VLRHPVGEQLERVALARRPIQRQALGFLALDVGLPQVVGGPRQQLEQPRGLVDLCGAHEVLVEVLRTPLVERACRTPRRLASRHFKPTFEASSRS
jgi:hypothetical protein